MSVEENGGGMEIGEEEVFQSSTTMDNAFISASFCWSLFSYSWSESFFSAVTVEESSV